MFSDTRAACTLLIVSFSVRVLLGSPQLSYLHVGQICQLLIRSIALPAAVSLPLFTHVPLFSASMYAPHRSSLPFINH